jgi:hypothetical protein
MRTLIIMIAASAVGFAQVKCSVAQPQNHCHGAEHPRDRGTLHRRHGPELEGARIRYTRTCSGARIGAWTRMGS